MSDPSRPKKRKRRITAAELMALLEADPAFVERRKKLDDAREKRHAELARAEAPLVTQLRALGYAVESVWDLVNTKDTYPDLIPILFEHLARPYPDVIREGIARALAVPGSKDAGWETLKRLYRNEQQEAVKDGLAVALAGAADDEVLADIITLIHDESLGPSRVIFLSALERSKRASAQAALMSLGTHPQLGPEARASLTRRLRRRTRARRR